MDYKVEWSPEATEDLQAIAEYIERDSEFYARAVVTKILDVSRSVRNLPLAGRVVPEIGLHIATVWFTRSKNHKLLLQQ